MNNISADKREEIELKEMNLNQVDYNDNIVKLDESPIDNSNLIRPLVNTVNNEHGGSQPKILLVDDQVFNINALMLIL